MGYHGGWRNVKSLLSVLGILAEQPSEVLSSNAGAGQSRALHTSPTARNSVFQSNSGLHGLFNFISPLLLKYDVLCNISSESVFDSWLDDLRFALQLWLTGHSISVINQSVFLH